MNFLLAATSIGAWLDTTFAGFDLNVFRFFGQFHSELFNKIALIFTSMGAVPYAIMFALFGVILILFKKTRKFGFAIVFAVIIGTVITNIVLKPMAVRIRPYNSLQQIASYFGWYTDAGLLAESDFSFPSGHTTAAFEIAVALCCCFASTRKGKVVCWIPPVIAVGVGASRIYLMVHYATDVIAGMIVGIFAGIVGYFLSKAICKAFDRSRAGISFDLERVIKKKLHTRISKGAAFSACLLAFLVIFMAGFLPTWKEAYSVRERCAYEGEYKCYNEAQTGSKYPAINGEYYCKIHWKELN